MVSSWASLDGLAVLSMSDIVYTVLHTVLHQGKLNEKYYKNYSKLWTKILQNWLVVASRASLDGLAVLGVSDMVYIT